MYTLSGSLAFSGTLRDNQMNFSGFGKLEYSFSSKSQPNEEIFLNFSVSSSCEAEAWLLVSQKKDAQLKNGAVSKYPVCNLVSGYCCGWVSAVYNAQLVTLEVACKAAGHRNCTFLTALPGKRKVAFCNRLEKLEEHLRNYLQEQGRMDEIGYFTTVLNILKFPNTSK